MNRWINAAADVHPEELGQEFRVRTMMDRSGLPERMPTACHHVSKSDVGIYALRQTGGSSKGGHPIGAGDSRDGLKDGEAKSAVDRLTMGRKGGKVQSGGDRGYSVSPRALGGFMEPVFEYVFDGLGEPLTAPFRRDAFRVQHFGGNLAKRHSVRAVQAHTAYDGLLRGARH